MSGHVQMLYYATRVWKTSGTLEKNSEFLEDRLSSLDSQFKEPFIPFVQKKSPIEAKKPEPNLEAEDKLLSFSAFFS